MVRPRREIARLNRGRETAAAQAAVAPSLRAVVLGGQFSVQTVGERHETARIGPQRQQAAGLARRAGGNGGSLKEGDSVESGVELGMARQEVGSRAPDYPSACQFERVRTG